MPNKMAQNQTATRRVPSQQRARVKVELMLEAATRLIDRDGLEAVTTNRVAELAGVSIGSLYQYFPNKRALLEALAERELQAVMSQVLAALQGPAPDEPGGRVRQIVRVVFGAFGGRTRVQRQLLDRALMPGRPMSVSMGQGLVATLLSGSGVTAHSGKRRQPTPTEAFVLTQSFVGVVRAALVQSPEVHSRQAIEDALVRLMVGFFALEGRAVQGLTA